MQLYFGCLPEDKVPFIGAAGESRRKQQLLFQLPVHDQDATQCQSLTGPDEKREFRMFVAERKRDALGQGTVRQIPQTHYGMECTRVRLLHSRPIYIFKIRWRAPRRLIIYRLPGGPDYMLYYSFVKNQY